MIHVYQIDTPFPFLSHYIPPDRTAGCRCLMMKIGGLKWLALCFRLYCLPNYQIFNPFYSKTGQLICFRISSQAAINRRGIIG